MSIIVDTKLPDRLFPEPLMVYLKGHLARPLAARGTCPSRRPVMRNSIILSSLFFKNEEKKLIILHSVYLQTP